jgi:hypothetical protein
MNGKRFASDTNAIAINSFYNYPASLAGRSNLYFIKVDYNFPPNGPSATYSFSGLFDGKIGDSILITKGRFDFKIDANQIHF